MLGGQKTKGKPRSGCRGLRPLPRSPQLQAPWTGIYTTGLGRCLESELTSPLVNWKLNQCNKGKAHFGDKPSRTSKGSHTNIQNMCIHTHTLKHMHFFFSHSHIFMQPHTDSLTNVQANITHKTFCTYMHTHTTMCSHLKGLKWGHSRGTPGRITGKKQVYFKMY